MNNNKILSAANDFLSNNQGVTVIAITKNNNTFISLDMDNGNSNHYEALVSALEAIAASSSTNLSHGITSAPTVNMYQPKYKLETVARLLNVTKQTLSNWGKENKIALYKEKGRSTYVLEQDLQKRYMELRGVELQIDDEFRSLYRYL